MSVSKVWEVCKGPEDTEGGRGECTGKENYVEYF